MQIENRCSSEELRIRLTKIANETFGTLPIHWQRAIPDFKIVLMEQGEIHESESLDEETTLVLKAIPDETNFQEKLSLRDRAAGLIILPGSNTVFFGGPFVTECDNLRLKCSLLEIFGSMIFYLGPVKVLVPKDKGKSQQEVFEAFVSAFVVYFTEPELLNRSDMRHVKQLLTFMDKKLQKRPHLN